MRLEAYEISCDVDGFDFGGLLEVASKLTGSALTVDIGGIPFRYDPLSKHGSVHQGWVTRIRMTNIPEKVRRSGEREPIELDADQGLGESNAFLFDPAHSVLYYQSNHFGMSASKFCQLISDLSKYDSPIAALPVPNSKVLSALRRMKLIRKYVIKYAHVRNAAFLTSSADHTAGEALELSEGDTPSVQIEVGVGRERNKFLEKGAQIVRKLFGESQQYLNDSATLEKFVVTGRDSETEGDHEIDLLDFKVFKNIPNDKNGLRSISVETRLTELRKFRREVADEVNSVLSSGD